MKPFCLCIGAAVLRSGGGWAAGLFLGANSIVAAAGEPVLFLTQTPLAKSETAPAATLLDARYPPGSRVVAVPAPYQPSEVRFLSQGLTAAGDPVLAPGGQRILFVGKATSASTWQVYEAAVKGGAPKRLTGVPGGAMSPDVLSTGDLVFLSPVPPIGPGVAPLNCCAIYRQAPQGPAQRLTYAVGGAGDLTVLSDGRILFVTSLPEASPAAPHQAFFTVNNDGTEFSLYAGQHERPRLGRRPREIGPQLAYLAAAPGTGTEAWVAEGVRTARPFSQPLRLFPFVSGPCRSVSGGSNQDVLASLKQGASFAIYRLATNATALGVPLFDDPAFDDVEGGLVAPRPKPMGHISAMAPTKRTGTIICLDANYTSYAPGEGETAKAFSVRVTAWGGDGQAKAIGEVALEADGSFMAEVPIDVPLGFEALDAKGQVLRQTPPVVWVRAGENRSCIGCHEPHGRTPRNHRPLAPRHPAPCLPEAPGRAPQLSHAP